MFDSSKVLVAGSTGYLGRHILKKMLDKKMSFCALARNDKKLRSLGLSESQIIQAQVTNREELSEVCDGIDVVISSLGITRQKDGFSYEGVDYQGNLNLLEEAKRAGVKKFIYISAFNAQNYPDVRLLKAKERFAVQLLNTRELSPCVIRPNGFFSDIAEIFKMAKAGRVYTFGTGKIQINPIHGEDLAEFCLDSISSNETERSIGGPKVYSLDDIANIAFQSLNKPAKITHIPDNLRVLSLGIAKRLPEKWGGPAEFFLTMLGGDAIAPSYGKCCLEQYFDELAKS